MTETAEKKLNLNPSYSNDEIFREVVSAFHLPDIPLKEYGIEALLALIGILFHILRDMVTRIAVLEDNNETLTFQAKKSSATSSMRPSSDGYVGVGTHKVDHDTLTEMDKTRNDAKRAGKTELPEETIADFERRYDEILEEGFKMHPLEETKEKKRGRKKKGKARSLLERIRDHKAEFLPFLHRFDVPFTSNEAEKSFRMVAVKRSVTCCFRTEKGTEEFVLIWSYLPSAHKHNIPYYDAIYQAFCGNAVSLLFPDQNL